jgi:DNA-binding MarR family transcriptional regulator
MNKSDTKSGNDIGTRWSKALADGGFTPIVNAFLEHYARPSKADGLGITTSQAMTIIHLLYYKRDARMPYPGVKTLAARLGVTQTTVRTNLRVLAKKGLLIKHLRVGRTALYDLTPLFVRLEVIQAKAKEKKSREKAEAEAMRLPEYYNAQATTEEADAETVPSLAHV